MNGIDVKIVHAMLREISEQRSMRGVRELEREFSKALDDSDALAALGARWARQVKEDRPSLSETVDREMERRGE